MSGCMWISQCIAVAKEKGVTAVHLKVPLKLISTHDISIIIQCVAYAVSPSTFVIPIPKHEEDECSVSTAHTLGKTILGLRISRLLQHTG